MGLVILPADLVQAAGILVGGQRGEQTDHRKARLPPGKSVGFMGNFEDYYLLSGGNGLSGWI